MGQLQKPRAYQESFRGSFVVLWEKRTSELSPTRGAASDMAVRASVLCLSFFFFFSWIHAHSASIGAEPGQFSQNQAVSTESSHIGQQPKWPQQAEIGLESCQNGQNQFWMRPKHPKSVLPQFYFEYLLLLLCFLFCFVFCCVSYLLLSLFCESRS